MKLNAQKRLAKITFNLGLGATLALVAGLGRVTVAQTAADLGPTDAYPANEQGSLSGSTNGFNPFDLIHNARLRNSRSPEEFNQETGESLDNATSDFKRQQQILLNRQSESANSQQ